MSAGGTLRIGTRGSHLALAQADIVTGLLAARHPELGIAREIIKTKGDVVLDQALSKVGDKGLFTKELEAALLEGRVDLAVHSLKDLPTRIPAGLALGAVLPREDPSDAWISRSGATLAALPAGSTVGTSSLRRRAQLLSTRPDLTVVDLRGNVPTRLRKLDEGGYDAIVLARAGLVRLGLGERITQVLPPEAMLPAVSQGAIGIEIRSGDARVSGLVSVLDDMPTRLSVLAERALLARLEGGCQVPIGAWARLTGDQLVLDGLVSDVDGRRVLRARGSRAVSCEADAVALGGEVAGKLLAQGAGEILEEISRLSGRP